jgi:hypothetical protein
MRRRILLCAFVGLGACASANRIDRQSAMHSVKAKELADAGFPEAASKERSEADKLSSKANTRRGFENVMPVVFH